MTKCDQLRVPLNAYRPRCIGACRAFDRFRYAIRGPGDNTQAAAWLIDCMTMEAADAGKLCTTD